MTELKPMAWHARASISNGPLARQTALGILIPLVIMGILIGSVGAYEDSIQTGLKIFALITLLGGALFGLSYLIAKIFVVPKGIRTAFVMNEDGIFSSSDDQLVEGIIAAGGAFGVATSNITLMATPLTAKAGKSGHIPWDGFDQIVEKPSRNYFVLKKGRRTVYAVYTNEDNYTDVRAFIKRHHKAKKPEDINQRSAT